VHNKHNAIRAEIRRRGITVRIARKGRRVLTAAGPASCASEILLLGAPLQGLVGEPGRAANRETP
jgi:hypothetical protein